MNEKSPERSLIYVPDMAVLSQRNAEEIGNDHRKRWGVAAEGVVLPICTATGVPFKNDFTAEKTIRYKGRAEEFLLGDVVAEFARLGLDIYLTLDPTLHFIKSDSLHIIDISGDSSAQACFSKKRTRKLLVNLAKKAIKIVTEECARARGAHGVDAETAGVAIDLTDILPMGASNERIELTCFCNECREQLASYTPKGKRLFDYFETFPSPWNMTLKDAGSGIGQINELEWDTPPERIIGLSKMKDFESFEDREQDSHEQASALIEYLRARHTQVTKTAKDIFAGMELDGKKRILITEGSHYDWTSGTFLKKLDDPAICDELWFEPTANEFDIRKVQYRSFLWKRSSYFLNAFFQMLNQSQDSYMRTYTGLARHTVGEIEQLLKLRMRQVLSSGITEKLDLFLLPDLDEEGDVGRIGFVAPCIDENICASLVGKAKVPDGINENKVNDDPKEMLNKLAGLMGLNSGAG
uniref:Uncharacterized protein n=1 Tax=Candidatus Kentrum sp. LPFa TaxID=2126335 RepID=A0A450XNV9_9GAMM|nr:MAG: hypothetical protein BECKLPF1236A_GA0070988_101212 [Candidatus Kentron sp. LPFa]VFK30934.1 MAG: hypothetical protein BECKLPF1236C_GA0070990_101242 [Candidatus Kentron sp. LPFa]